jgi:ribonuclease D
LLIDPLKIGDLSALGGFFSRAVVWMHGADYDMTMLKRQFGSLPPAVYDTQIGARLLGARRFGLADLVSRFFGIELSKTSQKADWGKRPLPPKMVEYALNDVRYLLPMSDMIVAQLRDFGRYEWFVESCEAARTKVLERGDDSREDVWRIKGSGKFDPRTLACLKALWYWRDGEAEKWDRPSFMVAPNHQWSMELAADRPVSLPRHFRSDRVKSFRQMQAELKVLPESEWPVRQKTVRRKHDRSFEQRVDALLKQRDKAAEDLDIEPSLVASRAVLEAIVANETDATAALLSWQRTIMGW